MANLEAIIILTFKYVQLLNLMMYNFQNALLAACMLVACTMNSTWNLTVPNTILLLLLFRSWAYKRKGSLEVTFFCKFCEIHFFWKNWIMGHIIWLSMDQKWSRIGPEVNQKWVGSGMRGIYKCRALAPCDFFKWNLEF